MRLCVDTNSDVNPSYMSVYTYEVKNVLATRLFKIHVHAAVKKGPAILMSSCQWL